MIIRCRRTSPKGATSSTSLGASICPGRYHGNIRARYQEIVRARYHRNIRARYTSPLFYEPPFHGHARASSFAEYCRHGIDATRLCQWNRVPDAIAVRLAKQQLLTDTYSLITINSRHAMTVSRHSMVRGVRVGRSDCPGHGIVCQMENYGVDGVQFI